MDWVALKEKGVSFWQKYKFALLILAVGIALMLIPGREKSAVSTSITTQEECSPDMEERLEEILSKIEGAGKVSVMVTLSSGEEKIFQQDEDVRADGSYKYETVIITDSQRNQQAVVQQVIPESYQGVIVVCQGAGKATVKLSIIEAVAKLTGLGTDRISVLKMK
ncbi:MAG: stage III sporulation protein AG [Oscillospiraceae bacterium]|nr:stage III sporulation protein AG [Oscillospiraceae bacterium]